MQIVTVEYRRLRTFGDYQNETIGATAEVEPHETAEQALMQLRGWVDSELGDRNEQRHLSERNSELRFEAANLERRIEAATMKWAAIVAFMEKLGIERPADIPDTLEGLPF